MLLDRYSPTPCYYATPKVGHLPPGEVCPVSCPQSNSPSRSVAHLVKVHAKLPVGLLAAYPYLTAISISVARCEIRISSYSIGSLVWALTKGQVIGRGAFDRG